jgi:hypothetical protein
MVHVYLYIHTYIHTYMPLASEQSMHAPGKTAERIFTYILIHIHIQHLALAAGTIRPQFANMDVAQTCMYV